MKNKNRSKGFTLVELMIVVVIVGILATIGVPIYRTYTRKAIAAEGRALIGAIASAERVYYAENAQYLIVSQAVSVNSTLGIDARNNKYFRTFTVTGNPTGIITITTTSTGLAQPIIVTGTMSPTTSLNVTESGI